jgi:hypothetical protein
VKIIALAPLLHNKLGVKGVKMNEARKILLANGYWNNGEDIDTALKQLRELVEGKKKEVDCTGELDCPCLENIRWNKCVEDIADMIYKEEK